MTEKRLRYVCSECGENYVTAKQAARHHTDAAHEAAKSIRKWVVVE